MTVEVSGFVRNKRAAWITWEVQPRNRNMAKSLRIPLYELLSNRPRLIRYGALLYQTTKIVVKNKFDVVFVQNPSIVLSLWMVIIGAFNSKMTVVVDAHNSGIYPLEGKSKLLGGVAHYICRRADYTIVTNSSLAAEVVRRGGKPIVMTDPLEKVSQEPLLELRDLQIAGEEVASSYVVLISTWADDEPYQEVVNAARVLTGDTKIYITGNYKNKVPKSFIENLPENVILTGFIDRNEYVCLLRNARATIDLTTRDSCLVCGAYESVSYGVPGIISDTPINRAVFYKGFLFSENTSEAIARSIEQALANEATLQAEIAQFEKEYQKEMALQIHALIETVFIDAERC